MLKKVSINDLKMKNNLKRRKIFLNNCRLQMLIVLFKNIFLLFANVDCFSQKFFFLYFALIFESCKHECYNCFE